MMNRKMLVLAVSVLCGGAQSAVALEHAPVIRITAAHPDVRFRLKANATTGFHWFLSHKPVWMQAVDSHYIAPKTTLIGAPGSTEWHFRWPASECMVARRATLSFVYAREWMPASSDAKHQQVTVYCRP